MSEKRKALKLLLGAGVANAILPKFWTKPVLDSVVLPAHAQTSLVGSSGEVVFGKDYTIDNGGASRGVIAWIDSIDESNCIPNILKTGTTVGDLVFEARLLGGSAGSFVRYGGTSGSGDAFVEYTCSPNGVEAGPFVLTILNISSD